MRRLAGILVLVMAASCAGADARPAVEMRVDTVGDTIVVRTLAGSIWGPDTRMVAEVSIGEIEGEDAYMLGSVRGLAVTPAGEILALDTQIPKLREYGPDGRHVRDIGRDGGGPGEYERPDGGIAALADGRILVRDPGTARINVYAADGTSLGEWRLASGGGWNTSDPLYVDTAGNVYTMVLRERGKPPWEWRYALARYTSDGVHTDSVLAPEWDYDPPRITGQTENSSSSSNVPFSPTISWTFSPLGYTVGGLSTDYRVDLFRTDAPVLRIERDYEPVPVGSGEKAEREDRATRNMRQQYPGWRWNGPPIPDDKPPFRGIFVGRHGRIWVQLSQPSDEIMTEAEAREEERRTESRPSRFRERVAFDVFEPDGRYLGMVRAPAGFSTSPDPVFDGDHIWAIVRDELDVQHIVRFRIEHGGPEM
ncbi:MAG: hypothetical protein PVH00_01715 [Gemmatimonadota bacterium]|jgi:hypothetical protein